MLGDLHLPFYYTGAHLINFITTLEYTFCIMIIDNIPCVLVDNYRNKGLGVSVEDCNMNLLTSDKDKNKISEYLCLFLSVLRLTLLVIDSEKISDSLVIFFYI